MAFAQGPFRKDRWLYGGLYEVEKFDPSQAPGRAYQIRPARIGEEYYGRLIIQADVRGRNRRRRAEALIDQITVLSLAELPYGGREFPGFGEVILDTRYPEDVNLDWLPIMRASGGLYLLTEVATGQQYVGSAYGYGGFWSRWQRYFDDGHGDNKLLKELVQTLGERPHYQIAVLEVVGSEMSERDIIEREIYWKRRLGSRPFGVNANEQPSKWALRALLPRGIALVNPGAHCYTADKG